MRDLVRLAIVPRDGFFCKDGRGWFSSVSGRGHGLEWPLPSTVLGALRTAWGRQEEARTGRAFSPEDWRSRTSAVTLHRTLVLRRPPGAAWKGEHRVWPAPADALRLEGHKEVYRLDPVRPWRPTVGRDDDEAREALWVPVLEEKMKPVDAPRWWDEARLLDWLVSEALSRDLRGDAFDVPHRVQAHVGIRPEELTAAEGVLFAHDVMETIEIESEMKGRDRRAEWAIGMEASLPSWSAPAFITLGSDSRLARVEPLPAALFGPPQKLLEAFERRSRGLRVVVVTPACFERGWLPDGMERQGREFRGWLGPLDGELVLRSAIVPRPLDVTGWDMAARTPKPSVRMVPPGAVYFFEKVDGGGFGVEDATALWLAALGARTEEGFGRVVPGVWTPRGGVAG